MFDNVLVIAHRAANLSNDCVLPSPWPPSGADVLELDVHWFRGRVEVRHSKALWPSRRLFENGSVLPVDASRPTLADVLSAVGDQCALWVDVKGPDPRLPRAVSGLVEGQSLVWVSARCWWQLAPFRRRAATRTFMSVGSWWQRPLARWAMARGWSDGIVIHERLASASFFAAVAEPGCIVAWAVESAERAAELIDLGIGGLIIDSPSVMSRLRSRDGGVG